MHGPRPRKPAAGAARGRVLCYHARVLRFRLIFGPAMIALLTGLMLLDNRLDQVDLSGTPVQALFLGRTYLPAGLMLLGIGLVVMPLAARELGAIFRAKDIPADSFMVTLGSVLGFTIIYAVPSGLDSQRSMALLATLAIGVFLAALVKHSFRRRRTQGALLAAGAVVLAMLYLGVLPGFFLLIRRWHSAWVVLAIMLITKSCDIGAYFVGTFLGRHKLIPWLSPKKTWEGLLGGAAASVLAAVALGQLGNYLQATHPGAHLIGFWVKVGEQRAFHQVHYPLPLLLAAGLVFGLVGQFGDLTASLFKRDAGIKDSGSSIPGFGGLLDVIDSPLIVAPVAYWLLVLMDATRL
jgi:phosphatidate cytidylyltransferase